MTKQVLDDLRVDASPPQQGGGRVAQVVHAHTRELCPVQRPLKADGDLRGVDRPASDKTGLANPLLELLQVRAAPWVVGLPPKAARLLPERFGLADDPWEVPKSSVVYIPEAYRLFGARSTQSQQGRLVRTSSISRDIVDTR